MTGRMDSRFHGNDEVTFFPSSDTFETARQSAKGGWTASGRPLFTAVLRATLLAFLLVCVASHSSYGQFYFGKNKVQYTRFNWQVMTTDHFRIYFYEDES